jgi:arylsulfatase A
MVATAAELTSATLTPGNAEDSFSFLPVLRGTQPDGEAVRDGLILCTGGGGIKSIRSGDWKLIDNPDGGGFRDPADPKPPKAEPGTRGQLYNLREDLGESTNLWDEYPEVVARLTRRLRQAVADGHTAPHCQP